MIRRNSSNIVPSVVENPVIAEHLTAAEGIRVDKPITGLNHVVNSVNFELDNDNTYVLRKPIVYKNDNYLGRFLLYDKKSELVIKSQDSTPYIIIEDSSTTYNPVFKLTDYLGVTYTYDSVIYNNIFEGIDFSDLKILNTNNTNVIYNVKVNLSTLLEELGITLYEPSTRENYEVYRLFSVYYEDDNWVVEMINPEINTFTGDINSATNFNPNILLDNPYALKDLYNYGSNSVAQILAYINKNSGTSNDFIPILENVEMNISLNQAIFGVSIDSYNVTIYTKVNITTFNPSLDLTKDSDDVYNACVNYNSKIKCTVNGNLSYEMQYGNYIPAGTVLYKYDSLITANATSGSFQIKLQSDVPIYIVEKDASLLNISSFKYFQMPNIIEHTVNYVKDGTTYINEDSTKFGIDVIFEDGTFKITKFLNDVTYQYITLSETSLTEEDAKKQVVLYSDLNLDSTLTSSRTYYIWLWDLDIDTSLNNFKVCHLTERSDNISYEIVESISTSESKNIVLKAFVTTQYINKNCFCIWEFSEDGGETWNVSPDFVEKMENSLINIPVQDITSSSETLQNADTYVKYLKMAPFEINSNQDLIKDRPDVLIIPSTRAGFKYRFSVYKYSHSTNVHDTKLMYNTKHEILKINNSYILSNHPLENMFNSVHLNVSKHLYSEGVSLRVAYFKDIEKMPSTLDYIQVTSSVEIFTDYVSIQSSNIFRHDTSLVNTWYYHIALFNANGQIIPESVCKLVYYNGKYVKDYDVTDDYYTPTELQSFSFIPQIQVTVETNSCRIKYNARDGGNLISNDTPLENLTVDEYSYPLQYTEHTSTYELTGTLYNESNIPQIIYLASAKINPISDSTSDLWKLLGNLFPILGDVGTVKVGENTITYRLEDSDIVEDNRVIIHSNLDVSHRNYIIIPAKSSLTFSYNYTITLYPYEYTTISDVLSLVFAAVQHLAFKTLSGTYIPVKKNLITDLGYEYGWVIYDSDSFNDGHSIIPLAKYDASLHKDSDAALDTDLTLPKLVLTTLSSLDYKSKAHLLSQKEYTFNISNTETKTLVPEHIRLETAKTVFYNNQIIFYGVAGHEYEVYVSDVGSFIVPMYNTINLTYGSEITRVLPWRNYLVIFTRSSIYLTQYHEDSNTYSTKLVNTSIGLSESDADTAVDMLNSVIFKTGVKVYKLYPNQYATTDSVLNITNISIPIEKHLTDSSYNFAFANNENYFLFVNNMCYVYNYIKQVWTVQTYPVGFISYDIVNLDRIYLYTDSKQYYFNYSESLSEYDCYGDHLTEDTVTPIPFSIDFGQKASRYADNKQFLGSKLILGTLSEKDIFPFDVHISTDGMSRTIHIDETTDSALWKTSVEQPGTLSTRFVDESTETIGTLRQMVLKYSGRGKTIRHVISGQSKHKFKFYSLDYKYRNLPNK